jgi:hypothetical protein
MREANIVFSLVAATAFATTATQARNLILNPGFELDGHDLCNQAPLDWNYTPAPPVSGGGFLIEYSDTNGIAAHSGSFSAIFGNLSDQDDIIFQSLPTITGATYDFNFWLDNEYSQSGTYFTASWGGTTVLQINPTDSTATSGWTDFDFTEVATGPTTVSFAGRNYPSAAGLDDVSVTAVPEPGAAGLFGLGFAVLMARRRRQIQ